MSFVFEHLPSLLQGNFPFEGYDALQDATLVADFRGEVADLHAFVSYRSTKKQLIVSIAGTSTALQGLYDVWGTRRRHPSGKGEVHRGFWSLYKGIRSLIIDGIRKGLAEHDVNELVVTGHSMGGALSYLLLLELVSSNNTVVPTSVCIKLVAFGAPRVGDTSLGNYWQELWREYRNRNGADAFTEYSVKAYNDGLFPHLS